MPYTFYSPGEGQCIWCLQSAKLHNGYWPSGRSFYEICKPCYEKVKATFTGLYPIGPRLTPIEWKPGSGIEYTKEEKL